MKLERIVSTALGTGYSPIAPGTVGSALGIILFYILNLTLNHYQCTFASVLFLNILSVAALYWAGLIAIKKIHEEWQHDDNRIVIDEVIGIGITILAVPFSWKYYLAAFVLFRIFDIWKPLYIRKIDNVHSNNSVILDDVLAGVYANIVLQIIVYFSFF